MNDKKNLVLLTKELYPQLRQKGKILVLYITKDVMALTTGKQSTLKLERHLYIHMYSILQE
jgi:hypothetical protein